MEKKIKHKKKTRSVKSKKIKSENTLTTKCDEDGTLIFQYDLFKPSWIINKIKNHFNKSKDDEHNEDCKAWGLKV